MGLFGTMPSWARQLPCHARPSKSQIRRLEHVRREARLGGDEFLMHVASHPETTRRIQWHFYWIIKQQSHGAAESAILKQLLLSRLNAAVGAGEDLFGLRSAAIAGKNLGASIHQILRRHPTAEALIQAMIDDELRTHSSYPTAPGYDMYEDQVAAILSETGSR